MAAHVGHLTATQNASATAPSSALRHTWCCPELQKPLKCFPSSS
ncbi:hypothetical protein COLO4_30323 [Corchorus olitorius]|uniref:Uncharacterized protein n=1 Tax=Corchorus olitorius TaxID=93759 RepID=A0A1R3H967_9ROSI|nr:hypothetical protein COLO4_30323 [Corchorus olitorius]